MPAIKMIPSTRVSTSRAWALGVSLVFLAIVGAVTAAIANPPPHQDGAYDLLVTQASINHQNNGFCSANAGEPTCKEWCVTTIEGYVYPQGQFVCVDE